MESSALLLPLLAGAGIALLAGPLGCFVVWRRMAYFGDAIAHSALLGIALATSLHMSNHLGILIGCSLFALMLIWLQARRILSVDTLLGFLAHAGLAAGIVWLSWANHNNDPQNSHGHDGHGHENGTAHIDLHSYLLGDILTVQLNDIAVILCLGVVTLAMLVWHWQKLVLVTLHEELAQAEGIHVAAMRALLIISLTIFVIIAVNAVGVLLMTSLLIIPAAAASLLARSHTHMAIIAAIVGLIGVSSGLLLAHTAHLPPGPSIVLACVGICVICVGLGRIIRNK